MNNMQLKTQIPIKKYRVMIVLMTIVVTFTRLRISFFGIGELILIYIFLKILITNKENNFQILSSDRLFSCFWFFNIFCLLVGLFINTVYQINYIIPSAVLFDLAAYLFILILSFTFETIFKITSLEYKEGLIKAIFFYGTIVMYLLFIFAHFISRNLFGIPLYYGDTFFSPLANDPHQFAYFITPLPFLGMFVYSKVDKFLSKIITVILILIILQMGIANDSTTLYVSWILSFIIWITLTTFCYLKKITKSNHIIIVFLLFALIICILNLKQIDVFLGGITEKFLYGNDAGAVRMEIWKNSIEAWKFSPVFGLGPGSHSGMEVFSGYESHNTFLQIITQSGLIGGIIYLLLIFKILKCTRSNIVLLTAFCSLLFYGFGINDLRRFILWFYFILIYFLSKEINFQKNKEKKNET